MIDRLEKYEEVEFAEPNSVWEGGFFEDIDISIAP